MLIVEEIMASSGNLVGYVLNVLEERSEKEKGHTQEEGDESQLSLRHAKEQS